MKNGLWPLLSKSKELLWKSGWPKWTTHQGKFRLKKKMLLVELFHLLKGIINFGEITVFLGAVCLTCVRVCGAIALESISVSSEPN